MSAESGAAGSVAPFRWPADIAERVSEMRSATRFGSLRRSIAVYYDDLDRAARMRALLARFVSPGDLVFDIGSHAGDRVAVLRELHARVVACEPQPVCLDWLQSVFGGVNGVDIVGAAVGRSVGTVGFHLNEANPTVSTAATDFLAAADGAEGWADQSWSKSIDVPVTTLDALIAEHGVPQFLKIDVEGYEAEVLWGLSQPVPMLSFEFTTIQIDVAIACLKRIAELGTYVFNVSLGETQLMSFANEITADEMGAHLQSLPLSANSGDVYARRTG